MTTINLDQAILIAKNWLENIQESSNELCLQLNDTIEKPYGWLFFYNSKHFLETSDFEYAIAGNAPLFIDINGHIQLTGTAEPMEYYISQLDKKYSGLK